MKRIKYFIPVVVVLVGLVLVGVFYKGDENEKSEKKEKKPDIYVSYDVYEKESWGFDIKYPEDWDKEILGNNAEGFAVGFRSPEEGEDDMFAQNLIVFAAVPKPQDFDKMMEVGINEMSADPSIDIDDYRKVIISEHPAYLIEYSIADATTEFKYLHYFINGGEFWYQILYTADIDGYLTFVEEAQKIIDSFVIKKSI